MTTDDAARSARAAIAMLTLQLRAARREADEAEAVADGWDTEAALAQLRGRMEPLIEQRRAALAAELEAVREECAEQVAAAHSKLRAAKQAAERLAAERAARRTAAKQAAAELAAKQPSPAHSPGETWPDDWWSDRVPPEPEAQPTPPMTPPARELAEHVPADDVFVRHARRTQRPSAEPVVEATVAEPEPVAAPASSRRALPAFPPPDAAQGPITIVIDAESFAKALSAAMSAVLDERIARMAGFQAWSPQLPPGAHPPSWPTVDGGPPPFQGYWTQPAQWMPMPVAQPPARKKSFWANTWHADVLLAVLAMVIVIVVLIAWAA